MGSLLARQLRTSEPIVSIGGVAGSERVWAVSKSDVSLLIARLVACDGDGGRPVDIAAEGQLTAILREPGLAPQPAAPRWPLADPAVEREVTPVAGME